MKKAFTFLITAITVSTTFGQITTTKVVTKVQQSDSTSYNYTKNFLGIDVYKYLGQELYLNGQSEILRKDGYRGFYKDYSKISFSNNSNIFKCCDGYNNSKYNELAGKYFTVLEVIKHPRATENESLYGKTFYLKLEEKEKKDIVYFEYDGKYEHSFPFIAVGYFNKLKQTEIGKEFILRGMNWLSTDSTMTDMRTGNPVSNFEVGAKWKCVDVTIEEKYYRLSLVLENEKREQIPISIDFSKNTNLIFEFGQAEMYKKKFGNENWQSILNGKVRIGMTKEMCELSWGKPSSINETITLGKKSEQYVYEGNYLYFDNEILTAMQAID